MKLPYIIKHVANQKAKQFEIVNDLTAEKYFGKKAANLDGTAFFVEFIYF